MASHCLKISKIVQEGLAKPIFITGVPRSGTTLFGKLISSFKGVEYHFEPPTLYMICCLFATGQIDSDTAESLLKVYLFEDCLMESLHGRKINLRPQDDSLILNSISWTELNNRWNKVHRRLDIIKKLADENIHLAVKLPNIMDAIPLLLNSMPESRILMVMRDGFTTVASLLKKGWLSDEVLEYELWPYQTTNKNVNIPYWVEKKLISSWLHWNQATRATYLWCRHAKWAYNIHISKDNQEQYFLLKYEDLLSESKEIIAAIKNFLNLEMTPFTNLQMLQIKQSDTNIESLRQQIYQNVEPKILEDFLQLNQLWGYNS